MRVHVPSPKPRDSGDFEIRVNPGEGNREPFAIIALDERSQAEICLDDLDDARRLVRASVDALHRLEASVKGEPHQFDPDDFQYCTGCGQARGAAIHAEPAPAEAAAVLAASIADGTPVVVANPPHHMTGKMIGPSCGAEDGYFICNAQEGHDGPDHVAYDGKDHECHRWPVAACECSHGQGEHDTATPVTPNPCLHPGCGCAKWRLAAPKAQPEPPVVVAGEVEDHPDTAGPAYGEAELRRADACRDHPDEADGFAGAELRGSLA